ncbi:MAG: hypothetical protein AB7D57_12040, partial [Desulfovibrionaceae bacterium]
WGLLLGLAAPAAALLGAWRLARRVPAWREALTAQLVREARAEQGVADDEPHFQQIRDQGVVRAFPRREFPAGLEAVVLLPRPESVVIAKRSGRLVPPLAHRPPDPPVFETRGGDATEVFYAGVSHVEAAGGQVTLFTIGGQEVRVPDGSGPAGRVAEYLRACVRNRQSLGTDARPAPPPAPPAAPPAEAKPSRKGCHDADAHVLTADDPFAVD